MPRRKIIPYNPKLKQLARNLRNDSTKAEIYMWQMLKGRELYGYDFHRQKPLDNYIVDFFSHELMLAIELDGYSHLFDEVYQKDKLKKDTLNKLGVVVLHFWDEEIFNDTDNVFRVINNYIFEYEELHPRPAKNNIN